MGMVKKLKEVRAIKWQNDLKKLCQMLKEERLLYVVDICSKWSDKISIEFLSKMRSVDILEMITDLNNDKEYEHTIDVIVKSRFVDVIQKWSGRENENLDYFGDENDSKESGGVIEELRNALRSKKVLFIADICKEYDEDLGLDSLLE